jgi:hypothetical protein
MDSINEESQLTHDGDIECAICYEIVCETDVLEPCGHRIHVDCFWKSKSYLCPICRQVVKKPKPNTEERVKHRMKMPAIYIASVCIGLCMLYLVVQPYSRNDRYQSPYYNLDLDY